MTVLDRDFVNEHCNGQEPVGRGWNVALTERPRVFNHFVKCAGEETVLGMAVNVIFQYIFPTGIFGNSKSVGVCRP